MKIVECRLCYGTHGDSDECSYCGVKPECVNYKTDSGDGTLMASFEEFEILFDIVAKELAPDELELLDELIEAGGYTASTEDDIYFAGRVPDMKQLEAERKMEKKMRDFMHCVSSDSPRVWRAYSLLINGLNPVNVELN